MNHSSVHSAKKIGGSSIVDQALFAGTNFLLNVLLARWMTPTEYGAFAVAFSIYLLLAVPHSAYFIEPLLVLGREKQQDLADFLRQLLFANLGLSVILSLILFACSKVYGGDDELSQALVGLAFAAPFMLLMSVLRRSFYVKLEPHWSVVGGILYLFLLIGGLFYLKQQGTVTPLSACLLMGGASLLITLWFWKLQGIRFRPSRHPFRGIARAHWGYGNWMLVTGAMSWVYSDSALFFLTTWRGLEETSLLRASLNFVLPLLQLQAALCSPLVPWAQSRLQQLGASELSRLSKRLTAGSFGIAVCYCLGLIIFSGPILGFILNRQGAAVFWLMVLVTLEPVIQAVGQGAFLSVKVKNQPTLLFQAQVIGTVVALVGYVCLIPRFGIWGAAISRLFGAFVQTVLIITLDSQNSPMRLGRLKASAAS